MKISKLSDLWPNVVKSGNNFGIICEEVGGAEELNFFWTLPTTGI
jgi:hypothetical protein